MNIKTNIGSFLSEKKKTGDEDDYKTWTIFLKVDDPGAGTYEIIRFFDTETADQAREEGKEMAEALSGGKRGIKITVKKVSLQNMF